MDIKSDLYKGIGRHMAQQIADLVEQTKGEQIPEVLPPHLLAWAELLSKKEAPTQPAPIAKTHAIASDSPTISAKEIRDDVGVAGGNIRRWHMKGYLHRESDLDNWDRAHYLRHRSDILKDIEDRRSREAVNNMNSNATPLIARAKEASNG